MINIKTNVYPEEKTISLTTVSSCKMTESMPFCDKNITIECDYHEISDNNINVEDYLYDDYGNEYVIKQIEVESDKTCQIYASYNLYELENLIFSQNETLTIQLSDVIKQYKEKGPNLIFKNQGISLSTIGTIEAYEPINGLELLKKIQDIYEVEFIIKRKRGSTVIEIYGGYDGYSSIKYGSKEIKQINEELNIIQLNATYSSVDYYNAITAYGKDGICVDVDLSDYNTSINKSYSRQKRVALYVNNEIDNLTELRQEATKKLQEFNKPDVSYDIEIIDNEGVLENFMFYAGDTVIMNSDTLHESRQLRIIEATHDLLDISNSTITIQSKRKTLNNLIK